MTLPLVVLAVLSAIGELLNLPFTADLQFLEHWLEPVVEGNEAAHRRDHRHQGGAGRRGGDRRRSSASPRRLAVYLRRRVRAVEPAVLAHAWYYDEADHPLRRRPRHQGLRGRRLVRPQRHRRRRQRRRRRWCAASGRGLRTVQSGFVRSYALGMSAGVVVVLGYFLDEAVPLMLAHCCRHRGRRTPPSLDVLTALVVLPARRRAAWWRSSPQPGPSCSGGVALLFTGGHRRAGRCTCWPRSSPATPASSSRSTARGWPTSASPGTSASTASRCSSSCSPACCSRSPSSGATPHHDAKPYYAWLLLLEAGCLGVFVALDLFLFFVMFEIVLVPMYFLIGGWGYANRVYAALKFFLFTMFGSALMLVGIVATAFLHRDAIEDQNRAEAQEIVADAAGRAVRGRGRPQVDELQRGPAAHLRPGRDRRGPDVVDDSDGANPFDWSAVRWSSWPSRSPSR